jgi:dCMP deaminase
MLNAIVASQRSVDPSTKVGAAILDADHKLIGDGYNGPPKRIHPSSMPWEREGEQGKTKYEWVIHAEENAIDNATAPTDGATMYCTLQPCHECAKRIIQAGIRRVVYLDNKYKTVWFTQLAEQMLSMVDITCEQHEWSGSMKEVTKRINEVIKIG